jgi:hypothetical protein
MGLLLARCGAAAGEQPGAHWPCCWVHVMEVAASYVSLLLDCFIMLCPDCVLRCAAALQEALW